MADSKEAHQRLSPIKDAAELRSILDAISKYDLPATADWEALNELSTNTQFEALEANPDGVFEGPPGHFQAVADVYVTLNYGDKRDGSSMSDSYPAEVSGHINRGKPSPSIDRVTIDTSAFYN